MEESLRLCVQIKKIRKGTKMDNVNIQIYKDGNDIIVVFKNSSDELCSVIERLINGIAQKNIAAIPVPSLEPQEEEPLIKPSDFDSYEHIIPNYLEEDFGDIIDSSNDLVENKTSDNTQIIDTNNKQPDNKSLSNKEQDRNGADPTITESKINIKNRDDFVQLCAAIKKPSEHIPDNMLSNIRKAVLSYYQENEAQHEKRIDFMKRGEMESLIIAYDKIFHETVLAVIEKRTFRNLISFLNFENTKGIRNLCAECIKEMKKYIDEYVIVDI